MWAGCYISAETSTLWYVKESVNLRDASASIASLHMLFRVLSQIFEAAHCDCEPPQMHRSTIMQVTTLRVRVYAAWYLHCRGTFTACGADVLIGMSVLLLI